VRHPDARSEVDSDQTFPSSRGLENLAGPEWKRIRRHPRERHADSREQRIGFDVEVDAVDGQCGLGGANTSRLGAGAPRVSALRNPPNLG